MKFIHTADWQIGMTFRGFKEKSRVLMEDDRFEVIDAIADYANNLSNALDFVLVCGDMFETPRIDEQLVKKTFKRIEKIKKPVFVLAGNHEWQNTECIFASKYFQNNKPENFHILNKGINKIDALENVEIVAAPLEGKEAENDLVGEQIDLLEPTIGIRILAGHGVIDKVMPVGGRKDIISLEKIEKALADGKINYVAMGDRHSTTSVGNSGAVWYSGAPEPTDFDEDDQRNILVVEIEQGRNPKVEKKQVGKWEFKKLGSKNDQYEIRSQTDLDALEEIVESFTKPTRTAVKIYLDSLLDFDTETKRGILFEEWESNTLARFEVSQSSNGARYQVDPTKEHAPEGLTSYALEAYNELKERAQSGGNEAQVALEALKLLVDLAGRNK
jgi:DNA repair exonuclease SbcCD nuclease subunit